MCYDAHKAYRCWKLLLWAVTGLALLLLYSSCQVALLLHCFDNHDCPTAHACVRGRCVSVAEPKTSPPATPSPPQNLTCKQTYSHLYSSPFRLREVAISPTLPLLATFDVRGWIFLRDKHTMQLHDRMKLPSYYQNAGRQTIAFHPSRPALLVRNVQNSVSPGADLYQLQKSPQGTYTFVFSKHIASNSGIVHKMDVFSNGQFIAFATTEHKLGIAHESNNNLSSTEPAFVSVKAHQDTILAIKVSHDGRWLVSAAKDKYLKVWSLTQKSKTQMTLKLHHQLELSSEVEAINIDSQSRYLALTSPDHVEVYSLPDLQRLGGLPPTKQAQIATWHQALFVPGKNQLYALGGVAPSVIQRWDLGDLSTWKPRLLAEKSTDEYPSMHMDGYSSVDPETGKLYSTINGMHLAQWNTAESRLVPKLLTREHKASSVIHPQEAMAAALVPKHVLQGAPNETHLDLILFSLESGKVYDTVVLSLSMYNSQGLFFSPDGKFLFLLRDTSRFGQSTFLPQLTISLWKLEPTGTSYRLRLEREQIVDQYMPSHGVQASFWQKGSRLLIVGGHTRNDKFVSYLMVFDTTQNAQGVPSLQLMQTIPMQPIAANKLPYLGDIQDGVSFPYNSMQISPNGLYLLGGTDYKGKDPDLQQRSHIWKLKKAKDGQLTLENHRATSWESWKGQQTGLVVDPTNRWMVRSRPEHLDVLDLAQFSPRFEGWNTQQFLAKGEHLVGHPTFDPRGGFFATTAVNDDLIARIYLWDLKRRTSIQTLLSDFGWQHQERINILFQPRKTAYGNASRLLFLSPYATRMWDCE